MAALKKYKSDPFVGGGKIGEFSATTTQVVKAFGYPTFCNDDIPGGGMERQSLFEWRLRTIFGPVMIYDYKEWEDPDFPEDKVICWQVGSRVGSYSDRVNHPALRWIEQQLGVPVVDKRLWCHVKEDVWAALLKLKGTAVAVGPVLEVGR